MRGPKVQNNGLTAFTLPKLSISKTVRSMKIRTQMCIRDSPRTGRRHLCGRGGRAQRSHDRDLSLIHISFGMVTVSGNTSVSDIMPSSRRGEGLGYYGLANNIAMSIGPMTGLFLHDACLLYTSRCV